MLEPAADTSDATATESTSTMRRDVVSAYAASAARIASWVAVSALVYRVSTESFATLALVRSTVGFLNYTSIGLAPALIYALAQATHKSRPVAAIPVDEPHEATLQYAFPDTPRPQEQLETPGRILFVNGLAFAGLTTIVGIAFLAIYIALLPSIHATPKGLGGAAMTAALFIGLGTLARLASDAPGAVLQTSGRIVLDNVLLMLSEAAWVAWVYTARRSNPFRAEILEAAGLGYLFSGLLLWFGRLLTAEGLNGLSIRLYWRLLDCAIIARLFKFGSLAMVAQLADFLYTPTDYILINRLIGPDAVAIFAPAIQIDAGLMLLVGALATVLLPKSALAHAAGDSHRVWRYYVRGTLASAAVLIFASAAAIYLAPWIYQAWLGDTLPETRRILPLILTHTVIGGSAQVGRSVLLAAGRVKAFTIAVLITGFINVTLSVALVRVFHLGLTGIILGTIVAAVLRGLIWMPWYVTRTLRPAANHRGAGRA